MTEIPLTGSDIHVTPINDVQSHLDLRQCWCRPDVREGQPAVIVHHSADGREHFEEVDATEDELEPVTEPGPCPSCGGETVRTDRGLFWCPDVAAKCWRKEPVH